MTLKFFFAKKRLLFYLEHYFLLYFDREQIEDKIAFFDQSKGKRLLKMLIFGLKIHFYRKRITFLFKILSRTFFCNQDHHQTLFLVVFSGETSKEKFKFSYKNYGFTPLQKWDFSDIKQLSCLQFKKPIFIYSIIKHYSSSYFHQKQIKKNLNFRSKSLVNPFRKI